MHRALPLAAAALLLTACSQSASLPATTEASPPAAPVPADATRTEPEATPSTTSSTAPTSEATQSGATTTNGRSRPRGAAAPWTATADPSTVAAAYAQAAWTMDTATDRSPTDAQHRAATYAMPSLAQALTTGGPVGGGGAPWAQLASKHGWTTATTEATPAQDAPDTPTTKARQVTTTITAHGDGGWTSTTLYAPQVVFVQLVPAPGGGWKVSRAISAPQ